MKPREETEIALSALIDHELNESELLPTIDRLVDDPELRQFWRDARALDDLALDAVAASRDAGRGDTASLRRVWSRIDDGTARSSRAISSRRAPLWTLAAAAAIVLVGLAAWTFRGAATPGSGSIARGPLPEGSGDLIEVTIGGERTGDRMSDQRFVELTAELLRSDERYHRKMQEILALVGENEAAHEGSRERSLELDRGDRRRPEVLEAADRDADDVRRRRL